MLPMVLIAPMPAAAIAAPKYAVGRFQNTGKVEDRPSTATQKAAIAP